MSDISEKKPLEEIDKGDTKEGESGENEGEEEEEVKLLHLHTRTVPAMVMLFGGGAAAIYTFVRHDSLLTSLEIIFVALVIFLVLGDVIKILLDGIVIEPPPEPEEKDKVIERSTGEEAGEQQEEEASAPQATEHVET